MKTAAAVELDVDPLELRVGTQRWRTPIWPGKLVIIDCIAELVHAVGAMPEWPVVASRMDGGFVFYRPRLSMRVLSFEVERDEWNAAVGWSPQLEEA